MDKFGIFNLLNSLVNNNSSQSGTQSEQRPSVGNLLGALFQPKKQTEEVNQKNEKPSPSVPLQSSMLSTMNSHDEFIKRVKEKNKALSQKMTD